MIRNYFNGGIPLYFMDDYFYMDETFENLINDPDRNPVSNQVISDLKVGYEYAKEILETRNQVCLWCHIKSILLFFQNNPKWLYRIPADMLIASYSTVGLSIHIKMLAFQKIIITKESIKYDLCLLLLLYGAEIFVLS